MKSELYLQLVTAFSQKAQFDEPRTAISTDELVAAMFNLPAEKAIEFLKAKGVQVTFDWREIQAKAQAKAFTIAKVTSLDLLQDVRGLLVKAQEEGKTFEQFKTEAQDAIAQRGWSGKQTITKPDGTTTTTEITPSRLQTVYRTNMQSAYNAGRWQQIQDTKAQRPYLQFLAIIDDSTSELCSKLNRKVFRADDPIWDKIMPPLHHNCRSTVRSLSQRQLEREGLTVEDGADYADLPEYAPAEGFDSNPGKTEWQPDLKKYDKDLAKAGEKELAGNFEARRATMLTEIDKRITEATAFRKDATRWLYDYEGKGGKETDAEYIAVENKIADVGALGRTLAAQKEQAQKAKTAADLPALGSWETLSFVPPPTETKPAEEPAKPAAATANNLAKDTPDDVERNKKRMEEITAAGGLKPQGVEVFDYEGIKANYRSGKQQWNELDTPELPQEVARAIEAYTEVEWYAEINKTLYDKNHTPKPGTTDLIANMQKDFQTVLAEDTVVFRGEGNRNDLFELYAKGELGAGSVIENKGFTSTSLSMHVARGFQKAGKNVLYVLATKKGSKVGVGVQTEVLFNAGIKIHVTDIQSGDDQLVIYGVVE